MLYSACRGEIMEIRKQLIQNDNLLHSSTMLDFEDKEISSYIYLWGLRDINLHKHELDVPFISNVLTRDKIIKALNIYLNILNDKEPELFKSLQKDDDFDLAETMDSFSEKLKDNFGFFGNIFSIIKNQDEELYKGHTPLDTLLSQPFMSQFCKGLNLNYREKIFFLLNLLNKNWGWLFPENEDDNYKIKVVRNFLNVKEKNLSVIVRNLNNRFIQLGLFSDDWTVDDFVYSFFCGKNNVFSLNLVNPLPYIDCYNQDALIDCNMENFAVWIKLIMDYIKSGNGGYELLCGSDYFRLKNLAHHSLNFHNLNLYELKPEMYASSRSELDFYLYAFSIRLKGQKAALLLPPELSKHYLYEESEERNVIYLSHRKRSQTYKSFESILKNIQVPVILCDEHSGPSSEQLFQLEENGINLLFSLNIKLPEKDIYEESVIDFFCKQAIPSDSLKTVIDFCIAERISPAKWKELSNLLQHTSRMTQEEVMLLLKNKYPGKEKKDKNLRKNSHYSLEALNTSEPVEDIVKAIKNAVNIQKDSPDKDTGIRLLLSGPSGTGKTAYVEETAKILNKPLSIIRASEILGGIVGETEQNIRAAFENAEKENAVLLIDEADSFLHSRGDSINRHNDLKVNEFLVQMERFNGILFCNTNLPEALDKATDRRFHFKIKFNPLTKDGVEILCKKYFEAFEISKNQIDQIYSSGEVCPGDFSALYGKIRFLAKEKLTAEYITQELCSIVKSKDRSWERKSIGFNA